MAKYEVGTGVDNSAGEEGKVATFFPEEDLSLFRNVLVGRTFGSAMERHDHDIGEFVCFQYKPSGCDEVVPFCIVAQQPPPPPPPPDPLPVPPLGAVSGPWELAGEPVTYRYVGITGGPRPDYSNRSTSSSTPSAPICAPKSSSRLHAGLPRPASNST